VLGLPGTPPATGCRGQPVGLSGKTAACPEALA